jgi:hypothetical protein
MIAQVPAEGILLIDKWGPSKRYKVACNCGADGCEHMVDIEATDVEIVVMTYTTQRTNNWTKNRFQLIWTLLTKGYVEYEASIHMSKQQALNYSETLKSAITDVENFQAANNGNKK